MVKKFYDVSVYCNNDLEIVIKQARTNRDNYEFILLSPEQISAVCKVMKEVGQDIIAGRYTAVPEPDPYNLDRDGERDLWSTSNPAHIPSDQQELDL